MLFPAAGMMEMALAAACTFTQDAATHDIDTHMGVAAMSIAAPIVVPDPAAVAAGQQSDVSIVCKLSADGGSFTIDNQQGGLQNSCATGRIVVLKESHSSPQQNLHPAVLRRLARQHLDSIYEPLLPANSTATVAPAVEEWSSSGFLCAPQQIDSALHLGVADPKSGAKIPVGVGLYMLPHKGLAMPHKSKLTASMAHVRSHANSSISNFYMYAMEGCSPMVIEALETRTAKTAPSPTSGGEKGTASSPLNYSVQWEATDPECSTVLSSPATLDASVMLDIGDSNDSRMALALAPAAPATAAAVGLAALRNLSTEDAKIAGMIMVIELP